MLRFFLFSLAIATTTACLPRDACATLEPGASAQGLPLAEYSLQSQAGIFDQAFGPSLSKGPETARCCAWRAKGVTLAGCSEDLACSDPPPVAFAVGRPYSGSEHLGAWFCFVAVENETVVSVWGQYND
jgi:hypothetical protein